MTPAELLERTQWDTFWVPADAEVVDRPELLLLGCPRPSPMLNAVLRARGDMAARLAEVLAHQGQRATRWMVTDTVDAGPVEGLLARSGWRPGDEHEVRVLPVRSWGGGPRLEVRPVGTLDELRACVDVAARAFGGPPRVTEAELAADLRACTTGGRVHRFVAWLDGVPVGSGGLTAFPDLGFGLLWAGGVVPEARGRGAYTALLDARVARARALGLGAVGLYARVGTSAPIVARFGFGAHGRMRFWDRPAGA